MNRKELIRAVAERMREENLRKPVSIPKSVFHISDDNGNQKDFYVKQTDKTVIYTADDVRAVLDTCIEVIKDSIKRGDPISIVGFGSLGLKYRRLRATKIPGTETWVDVRARYMPKFSAGADLRRCARLYELSLEEDAQNSTEETLEDDGGGVSAD